MDGHRHGDYKGAPFQRVGCAKNSGLVAYSQVFVATVSPFLAPLLPSGAAAGDARLPAVALYSAVVIPLSCFDLAEQVGVQVAMAGRG